METCQPQGSCEGAAWLSSARAVFTAAKKENCKSAVDFDVNSKEIAAYLHGEEIAVSQDVKGYTAVCVNGITTGFGKASNSRLKNKYPKGLRILR